MVTEERFTLSNHLEGEKKSPKLEFWPLEELRKWEVEVVGVCQEGSGGDGVWGQAGSWAETPGEAPRAWAAETKAGKKAPGRNNVPAKFLVFFVPCVPLGFLLL